VTIRILSLGKKLLRELFIDRRWPPMFGESERANTVQILCSDPVPPAFQPDISQLKSSGLINAETGPERVGPMTQEGFALEPKKGKQFKVKISK